MKTVLVTLTPEEEAALNYWVDHREDLIEVEMKTRVDLGQVLLRIHNAAEENTLTPQR